VAFFVKELDNIVQIVMTELSQDVGARQKVLVFLLSWNKMQK